MKEGDGRWYVFLAASCLGPWVPKSLHSQPFEYLFPTHGTCCNDAGPGFLGACDPDMIRFWWSCGFCRWCSNLLGLCSCPFRDCYVCHFGKHCRQGSNTWIFTTGWQEASIFFALKFWTKSLWSVSSECGSKQWNHKWRLDIWIYKPWVVSHVIDSHSLIPNNLFLWRDIKLPGHDCRGVSTGAAWTVDVS